MFLASTVAFAQLAIAAGVLAGPLNPPAGPITSTPGPEAHIPISLITTPGDADSLFKITQPGSYYLTGSITGVAAKHGIEIAANGVTLDLNGFELLGVVDSLNGVTATGVFASIAVRNGSVRAWGGHGVALSGPIKGIVVSDLRAHGNGLTGIGAGAHAIVTRCLGTNNGADGISTSTCGTVSDCHAAANGDDGIDVGSQSMITASIAEANLGAGLEVGTAVVITACSASQNLGDGIFASGACVINGSVSYRNDGHGIDTTGNSSVSYSVVRNNGFDGIRAGAGSSILNNTCWGNGLEAVAGAGIRALATDTRIEGNNCVGQDIGIAVDAGGNVIVRNTCSGNTTNWNIAANNYFGPIINRAGVLIAAVSGDAAGSSLATTDPNANFTY